MYFLLEDISLGYTRIILLLFHLLLSVPARIGASGDLTPVSLPLLAPRELPLAHRADLGLLHLAPVEDAKCVWDMATHSLILA